MKTSALFLGIGLNVFLTGCGSDGLTGPLPPPPPPPPQVPFAVVVSLTDSVIGGDCRYTLAFQANDSTTTVSFGWNISASGSHLPGVGAITSGATGSFSGRHERVWQWEIPTGESFFLALEWALTATGFEASGDLSEACP